MANNKGTTQTWPLEVARAHAAAVVEALWPACEKVLVAGSVRRGKPRVGDVEIVVQPRMEAAQVDLFGGAAKERSVLDEVLARLHLEGRVRAGGKDGSRYKRLVLADAGIPLDLFIVRPPAMWGVIATIRTGPASYSKELVVQARRRGMRVVDGALVRGVCECGLRGGACWVCTRGADGDPADLVRVECDTERAFIEALGRTWVEPESRHLARPHHCRAIAGACALGTRAGRRA